MGKGGAAKRGRGGGALGWALGSSVPRVSPFSSWLCLEPCGRRTSPLRGWSLTTLSPCKPPGLVTPLGGPPNTSGGPGTLPVMPRTLPVAKTILPIYKSLPPDHSVTPRDIRDLIRDSEQHSVTTYIYSL